MIRMDLTGQRFGRRVVLSFSHVRRTPRGSQTMWRVLCDCGKESVAGTGSLRSRGVQSCGCATSDATIKRNTTHGMSHRPEYIIHKCMISRCENPNNEDYYNYGARGIAVCPEWRHDFARFFADMGPRPEGGSIDRIDNDKGYEPGNCRWVPASEQSRNRGVVKKIDVNGRLMTFRDIGEMLGIAPPTVSAYFRANNCTFDQYLKAPLRKRGRKEIPDDRFAKSVLVERSADVKPGECLVIVEAA